MIHQPALFNHENPIVGRNITKLTIEDEHRNDRINSKLWFSGQHPSILLSVIQVS